MTGIRRNRVAVSVHDLCGHTCLCREAAVNSIHADAGCDKARTSALCRVVARVIADESTAVDDDLRRACLVRRIFAVQRPRGGAALKAPTVDDDRALRGIDHIHLFVIRMGNLLADIEIFECNLAARSASPDSHRVFARSAGLLNSNDLAVLDAHRSVLAHDVEYAVIAAAGQRLAAEINRQALLDIITRFGRVDVRRQRNRVAVLGSRDGVCKGCILDRADFCNRRRLDAVGTVCVRNRLKARCAVFGLDFAREATAGDGNRTVTAVGQKDSILFCRDLAALDLHGGRLIRCIHIDCGRLLIAGAVAPVAGRAGALGGDRTVIDNQLASVEGNAARCTENDASVDGSRTGMRMVDRVVRNGFQNTAVDRDIAVIGNVGAVARNCIPAGLDVAAVDNHGCISMFVLHADCELTVIGVVCNGACCINQTAFHRKRTAIYCSNQDFVLLVVNIRRIRPNFARARAVLRGIGAVAQSQLAENLDVARIRICRFQGVTVQIEGDRLGRSDCQTGCADVKVIDQRDGLAVVCSRDGFCKGCILDRADFCNRRRLDAVRAVRVRSRYKALCAVFGQHCLREAAAGDGVGRILKVGIFGLDGLQRCETDLSLVAAVCALNRDFALGCRRCRAGCIVGGNDRKARRGCAVIVLRVAGCFGRCRHRAVGEREVGVLDLDRRAARNRAARERHLLSACRRHGRGRAGNVNAVRRARRRRSDRRAGRRQLQTGIRAVVVNADARAGDRAAFDVDLRVVYEVRQRVVADDRRIFDRVGRIRSRAAETDEAGRAQRGILQRKVCDGADAACRILRALIGAVLHRDRGTRQQRIAAV